MGRGGVAEICSARPRGGLHFCRDFAMFCEDIRRVLAPALHPRLFRPRPEVDASRSESALPVAVEEMGPRLGQRASRPLKLKGKTPFLQRARCPLSQCGRFRAAPPLRHAAEFGATLTHFHISTLSHFHNSTFSHFQRPHDSPPGGVGIAVCLAAAS